MANIRGFLAQKSHNRSGGLPKLKALLEKVYRERGFDFHGYKKMTLTSRLACRRRAQGVDTYGAYRR